MKNLLKPELVNRTWNKPKAQKKYESQLDAIAAHHQAAVDSAYNAVLDAVTTHASVKAYGREMLLMQLAKLGNIRLYDQSVDTGGKYAKYKQGEHQRAMSDALDDIIEEGIATLTIADAHNLHSLHTLRYVPEKQSARQRPVFDDDNHCILSGQNAHKLREWREEPQL